jgi:hypothetical protein
LHTKIPTIASGTDTELYIYYDSDHADNDTYVGDVNSTPGRTVWDSNFKAVYHLGEDPSGGTDCIKDSTSNINHGTPAGTMLSEDLIDGKFGKCLNFDGGDDNINCNSGDSLDDIATITVEAVINADTYGEGNSGRIAAKSIDNGGGWNFLITTDGLWYTPFSIGSWQHVAATYNSGSIDNNPLLYKNGVSQSVNESWTPVGTLESDTAQDLYIATRPDGLREFDGGIDEIRISSTIRPAAWLNTTYEGLWDNLLTFGTEEEAVIFYYEGYVTVESVPALRVVHLYKRNTGEIVDSTTSIGVDGYFKVSSTYDDYHFIVVLSDLSENYAILTDDKIHPTGGD